MWKRIGILGLVVVLTPIVTVQADKLILQDGRTLSGKVTVEKGENGAERIYKIVTDDGQTLTFPRDEVKRHKHEVALGDLELQDKLDAWHNVVKPVLDLAEPMQRQFLTEWREYAGGLTTRPRLWETPPSTDKFVDEWARYTAEFKAVAERLDYKTLMSRKRGSDSLREYSVYAPEGREEVAEALELALDAFEECVKLAKQTSNLVRNLPREREKQAARVRRRENEWIEWDHRFPRSTDPEERDLQELEIERIAARKHADFLKQINIMANNLGKKTQRADEKINYFARQRTVTLGHMTTARRDIEGLPGREGVPTSARQVTATPLPSRPVTREFRRLVKKHRKDAMDLTTVGLKALRERTRTAIEELFVGEEFALQLEVSNIKEAGADGYRLIANHRPDLADKVVQAVEFHFDGGSRHHLIRCRIGAGVEVAARIKRVVLTPSLQVLETSDAAAGVRLTGDVVSVTTGCRG